MEFERLKEGQFDLICGQLVKSRCGRDKDRIFVIKEILDNDYVLLIDGYLRKLEKPKLKKIKHVKKINTALKDYKELNDSQIRKAIKKYKEDSVNV
ncbi:MAG: KOW domain-containing RNA-binding protein [Tissierellia bacterium]|nr:KOW domain-containing RNA-binding protein [Tissierellia bacterium]